MKTIRFFILAAAAIAMACGCEKQGASLNIALDKESVKISASKTDAIEYTAKGYEGTVTVTLSQLASEISIQNSFDTKTGKGTVSFSTESKTDKKYDILPLTFQDTKNSIEKNISVDISSSWSVTPDDPKE